MGRLRNAILGGLVPLVSFLNGCEDNPSNSSKLVNEEVVWAGQPISVYNDSNSLGVVIKRDFEGSLRSCSVEECFGKRNKEELFKESQFRENRYNEAFRLIQSEIDDGDEERVILRGKLNNHYGKEHLNLSSVSVSGYDISLE